MKVPGTESLSIHRPHLYSVSTFKSAASRASLIESFIIAFFLFFKKPCCIRPKGQQYSILFLTSCLWEDHKQKLSRWCISFSQMLSAADIQKHSTAEPWSSTQSSWLTAVARPVLHIIVWSPFKAIPACGYHQSCNDEFHRPVMCSEVPPSFIHPKSLANSFDWNSSRFSIVKGRKKLFSIHFLNLMHNFMCQSCSLTCVFSMLKIPKPCNLSSKGRCSNPDHFSLLHLLQFYNILLQVSWPKIQYRSVPVSTDLVARVSVIHGYPGYWDTY